MIPAYNEEDYLAGCLDALVAQTRPVDEVLVVDNNSTDSTRAIAESYADRLPIVVRNEPQQGVMYARATGFDTASGDVIARTDADARMSAEWSKHVVKLMDTYPEADIVSGPILFYDMPGKRLLDWRVRRIMPKLSAAPPDKDSWPLSGGNMAIRKTAWEALKPFLLNDPDLHEDVDVSCAADKAGLSIWHCHGALTYVSARRLKSPFSEIESYIKNTLTTIEAHGLDNRAEGFKKAMPKTIKQYRTWSRIQRNYNPETGHFVPHFLQRGKQTRVPPMPDTH